MMRCLLCALLSMVALANSPARADDVGDLIRNLGADAFDVREKAESQLLAKGDAILSALKETIANTTDAETRMRCKRLEDAIQFAAKLAVITREYGSDPLKLEVAAKMMLKDRRVDEARALYRAAAVACRAIASGKSKHSMGPEMASRKADEMELRALADGAPAPARRGNVRIVRANGNAQIFINNIQINAGDEIENFVIDALDNEVMIDE